MSRDDAQRQPYAMPAGQTGPFHADREGVVTAANRYDEPTSGGMMSLQDALEAQAQMHQRPVDTPVARALPPGSAAHG